MALKLQQLRRVHPEYDRATLDLHADLFAGGAQFRRNLSRYLPQNDVEPAAVYERRKKLAHYLNYTAPIANYFASLLLDCPLQLGGAGAGGSAGDFYAALKEDCDGLGSDLNTFARARLTDALVSRRAWVRVEFPEGDGREVESAADFEAAGLGRARLVAVPATSITNWARDASGAFSWVVEYDRREALESFLDAEATVTETWTLWSADGTARRWALAYPKSTPPQTADDVPEAPAPHNPTGRMPLVCLDLPTELWLLNHLADAQLELFRKRCALSWSIDRTCYAMAVLKTKARKKPDLMGAGYFLQLGTEDSLDWPTPPSTPFEVIGGYVSTLKDEIHRVATQMAQGVDNNAAAVGRSGDSKAADAAATVVVLRAYGKLVAEMVERVLCLVAAGRGESEPFDVAGMDRYEADDPAVRASQAETLAVLEIPSETLMREALTRVALSTLADADEQTKATIKREIAEGLAARAAQAKPAKASSPADAETEDGAADAKEDAAEGEEEDPASETPSMPPPAPLMRPRRSPSSTPGTSRPAA